MSSEILGILSQNVRGMGDTKKRRIIFNKFRSHSSQILLLQETHSTVELENVYKAQWGNNNIMFSHGSAASRGVCIIIKSVPNLNVEKIYAITEGRVIIVKVIIKLKTYFVVNIYAPNNINERKVFFINLLSTMKKLNIGQMQSIVIGGDFNTPLENQDKTGASPLNPDVISSINDLYNYFNLIDIWRFLHPDILQYTWHRMRPLSQSRIDYFLISNNVVDSISNCGIQYGVRSDHSAVNLNIKQTSQRGPGFWKFNSLLLKDNIYLNKLKTKLQHWKEKYNSDDYRIKWEIIKYKIRKYTIKYSKALAKVKRGQIQALEMEINQLEKNLCEHNTKQYTDKVNQLEHILEEKNKGVILRSKIRWAEEGEKSTKYFFNLEKRNALNKYISQLQVDNQIINNPKDILNAEYNYFANLHACNKKFKNNDIADRFFQKEICN